MDSGLYDHLFSSAVKMPAQQCYVYLSQQKDVYGFFGWLEKVAFFYCQFPFIFFMGGKANGLCLES